MIMTLERLRMENFKGIKQLTVVFNSEKTEIRGMNGTGKTTIVDAFCWVLFNTNAAGDAPGSDNFREKPLDEFGQVIHNLDTTVELFCTLDGQRFDLKRTQSENWVKKRGNAEATFQGNVSTYWINGVETKQVEFKQRIKAIADDEVFRLVGSLSAFNQMEWKKRRAQLLALADSDVDGDLLAMDEYRPIADELAQRNISIDDLRKVLTDQEKSIKAELKMLPVRIDTVKKATQDVSDREVKDAEYSIKESAGDIEKIDALIADARAQMNQDGNRGKILALEEEIVSVKRRLQDAHDAKRRELVSECDSANKDYVRLITMCSDEENRIGRMQKELEVQKATRDKLRERYWNVKRTVVKADGVCPTCGQELPADKVQEAQARLEAAKRTQLSDIQNEGKSVAALIEDGEKKLAESDAAFETLRERVQAAKSALESAQSAAKDFPAEVDMSADERLVGLYAQLDELKANAGGESPTKIRDLTARKVELQERIDRNKEVLLKRRVSLDNAKMIKDYEIRQSELGAQLSETELLVSLVEQFITDRCGALEQSINAHFPTVQWKLFDSQINGGIQDVCMCMVDCDGVMVPYNTANTASQINADVEIVNVLSDKYGVQVPLFIDNSERVNVLAPTQSQLITLAVSTDDVLVAEGGSVK